MSASTLAVSATLDHVEIAGEAARAVEKDDGSGDYSREWTPPAAGAANKPVMAALKRGGTFVVTASFGGSLAKAVAGGKEGLQVVGLNPQVDFGVHVAPKIVVDADNDRIEVSWRGLSVLGPFLNEQTQQYAIRPPWYEGPVDWKYPAGQVPFALFSHDAPRGEQLFHTVLRLGAGAAASTGGNNLDAIKQAILDVFKNRAVRAADSGQLLNYYASWKAGDNGCTTIGKLLKVGDGSCDAWSQLLMAVLTTQGGSAGTRKVVIEGQFKGMFSRLPALLFVKNWEASGLEPFVNLRPEGPPPPPIRDDDNKTYRWKGDPVVKKGDGLAGQSNANPPAQFTNHAIVELMIGGNKVLYDPSYGGDKYAQADARARLDAFMARSISFGGFYLDVRPGVPAVRFLRAIPKFMLLVEVKR